MSYFVSFVSSFFLLLYYLIHDFLFLLLRPIFLFSIFIPQLFPSIFLQKAGLLFGLLGSSTIILIGLSIGALCHPFPASIVKLLSIPFFVDAMVQLPSIIVSALFFPTNTIPSFLISYPTSYTACLVLFLQIPLTLSIFNTRSLLKILASFRCILLAITVCLRVASRLVHIDINDGSGDSNIFEYFLSFISYITLLYAITPYSFHTFIAKMVQHVATTISIMLSSVYLFLTRLYPQMVAFFWRILSIPIIVRLYECLIKPVWCIITPLCLPILLAHITISTTYAVFDRVVYHRIDLDVNKMILTIGQLLCILTSLMSALILFIHALVCMGFFLARPFILIQHPSIVRILFYLCRVPSLPFTLTRLFMRRVITISTSIFHHTVSFAVDSPLLSIPIVLIVNGCIFYLIYASSLFSSLFDLIMYGITILFGYMGTNISLIQSSKQHVLVDSTAAVMIVAMVQSATYTLCKNILHGVLSVTSPPLSAQSTPLSASELESLASTMIQPRQCGRCFYGPVDHRGCNNLRTHHGDTSDASYISNACPRCGWFVSDLNLWPEFDSALAQDSGAGHKIFLQRVWGELVLIVRSSAKALLFPILLLQFSSYVLPTYLSSLLALSYIIPWILENRKIFTTINESQVFISTRSRRTHRNNATRTTTTNPGPRGQPALEYDNATCGSLTSNTNNEIDRIIQKGEAMAMVLSSLPTRIFLYEGTICPICLDEYDNETINIVSTSSNVMDAVTKLHGLLPPCIPLRCGHTLHLPCVEQVVSMATINGGTTRHIRCPLCRQAITLSGAASARFFN